MAQGARQSNLFAAEDFSVIYESFSQANFQAYDFDTIRTAMVEYINTNYPESFNDWISSSEFVSLIELMAFLGHNLAFRADLGSRENYLSTAERRESALRIAEFLNYTPTRNIVASGLLKIDAVRTTETVYDVNGRSLANTDVQFEDVNDPDTYQNFLTVMNAVFQTSSRFGSPFAKFISNGITNEIYKTNSINNQVNYDFNNRINNTRATFGIHSVYYNQNAQRLEEKTPNPYSSIDILYRNDNSGVNSPDTGFFVGFKQGSLNFKDFKIDNPQANMVIDINDSNVANGNIWVQTIDDAGRPATNWTRIDRLFGANAIFNGTDASQRNVFTVSSRENDEVSIVFGDGRFANIPRGTIRVWYRTGLNRTYTLSPTGFGPVVFSFEYIGSDGNTHTATVSCSLKSSVSNASQRESIDSIKVNAGRFFATQDRMITADDYSIFPLTASENIRKIKSINRVHSGHSRFRNHHDPTATYSDASMYTDDLYIYKDDVTTRSLINLPTTLNSEQLFQRYIRTILDNAEVKNFYYERHNYGEPSTYNARYAYSNTADAINFATSTNGTDTNTYRWNQVSKGSNTCTGYLTYNSLVQRLGDSATYPMRKLEQNSLIEFITAPYKLGYIKTIEIINGGSGYTTAPTATIAGAGTGASVSANIDGTGKVVSVSIIDSGQNYTSETNISFTGGDGTGASARVNVVDADTVWTRVVSLYQDGIGIDNAVGQPTGVDPTGRGAVVLSRVVPSSARIKRIVPSWESDVTSDIKTEIISKITNKNSFGLYYEPSSQEWRVIDSANLPSNTTTLNAATLWSRLYEADNSETGRDNSWLIRINFGTDNWEILTRKTRYVIGSDQKLKFNNLNFQETFSSETLKPSKDNFKILNINTVSDSDSRKINKDYKFNTVGYFVYSDGYTDPNKVRVSLADPDNDGFPNDPTAFTDIVNSSTLKLKTVQSGTDQYQVPDANGTVEKVGRTALHSQYNRISDINQVIDPASTNIIDTYVLLRSYETSFRTWANYDGRSYTKPAAPTIGELSQMFASLNTKKAVSDQVIYRPVKFKILFGSLANSELQARFHVTRTTNATMSDNEIKQQVVTLINNYFNIDNWDFGETFYFTELATYIHNNMIGQVAQINIQPVDTQASTDALFEINNDSDEMFMPIIETSSIIVNDNVLINPTTIAANTGVSLI